MMASGGGCVEMLSPETGFVHEPVPISSATACPLLIDALMAVRDTIHQIDFRYLVTLPENKPRTEACQRTRRAGWQIKGAAPVSNRYCVSIPCVS